MAKILIYGSTEDGKKFFDAVTGAEPAPAKTEEDSAGQQAAARAETPPVEDEKNTTNTETPSAEERPSSLTEIFEEEAPAQFKKPEQTPYDPDEELYPDTNHEDTVVDDSSPRSTSTQFYDLSWKLEKKKEEKEKEENTPEKNLSGIEKFLQDYAQETTDLKNRTEYCYFPKIERKKPKDKKNKGEEEKKYSALFVIRSLRIKEADIILFFIDPKDSLGNIKERYAELKTKDDVTNVVFMYPTTMLSDLSKPPLDTAAPEKPEKEKEKSEDKKKSYADLKAWINAKKDIGLTCYEYHYDDLEEKTLAEKDITKLSEALQKAQGDPETFRKNLTYKPNPEKVKQLQPFLNDFKIALYQILSDWDKIDLDKKNKDKVKKNLEKINKNIQEFANIFCHDNSSHSNEKIETMQKELLSNLAALPEQLKTVKEAGIELVKKISYWLIVSGMFTLGATSVVGLGLLVGAELSSKKIKPAPLKQETEKMTRQLVNLTSTSH